MTLAPSDPVRTWLRQVFLSQIKTKARASGFSGAACPTCRRSPSPDPIYPVDIPQGAVGLPSAVRLERDGTMRLLVAFSNGEAWFAPGDVDLVPPN